jgi:hypothetical protein
MPSLSELELILSVLTCGRDDLLTLLSAELVELAGALDIDASTGPQDPLWELDREVDFELVRADSELGLRLARLPEIHVRTVEETPEEFTVARQRLKILRSALAKRASALTAVGRYLTTTHAVEMTTPATTLPRLSSEGVAEHARIEERLIARVTRNARCQTPRGELDVHALFGP